MSIVDEQDLRQQLGSVLDAVTPSDAPVSLAVRKGKIIQAGRSLGIVAGLAVVAGIGVGTPGLLHQSVFQAEARARPTVMVEQICPNVPRGALEPVHQPDLVVLRALPAAELVSGGCAWLMP